VKCEQFLNGGTSAHYRLISARALDSNVLQASSDVVVLSSTTRKSQTWVHVLWTLNMDGLTDWVTYLDTYQLIHTGLHGLPTHQQLTYFYLLTHSLVPS